MMGNKTELINELIGLIELTAGEYLSYKHFENFSESELHSLVEHFNNVIKLATDNVIH